MTKFKFFCSITYLIIGYSQTLPNIIFVLVDDLGIYAPGYQNPELVTPALNALSDEGVRLLEHYTYRFCAPSRGAIMTGRFPFKLSASRNNYAPSSVVDGIDLSYTFLPQKLLEAGYMNHHIGKWHLGFYSNEYTPTYRGFHKSNGYLLGAQNHYDQQNNQTFDDYLCSGGPPRLYDIWSGSMLNEVDNQTTREERQGIYNSYSFSQQTTDLIYSHSSQHPSSPLFVYLALQNTHKPLEVPPQKYMDLYPSIKYKTQQIFYAMVSVIDDIMNNITIALKVTGMWNNTLIIWVSDNGSPVEGAGSNWPLKGSKKSNWEGGVKTPAFVSGGYLPPSQRNKSLTGMIHLVDWYSTISSLAGLDPNDTKGPTPVDGLNMWPWITGQIEESPRSHIVFDHYLYNGPPAWGAIRVDNYKLLVGPQNYSSWYGGPENNYFTPNYSDPNPDIDIFECDYDKPCLYDIREDPTEHIDISSSRPDILSSMMDYWRSLYNEYHPPRRKPIDDTTGYCRAASLNNWYVTPWITNTSDTNLPGKYMKDREILTKFPDHLDIFGNP